MKEDFGIGWGEKTPPYATDRPQLTCEFELLIPVDTVDLTDIGGWCILGESCS